jgi:hypothetical protein
MRSYNTSLQSPLGAVAAPLAVGMWGCRDHEALPRVLQRILVLCACGLPQLPHLFPTVAICTLGWRAVLWRSTAGFAACSLFVFLPLCRLLLLLFFAFVVVPPPLPLPLLCLPFPPRWPPPALFPSASPLSPPPSLPPAVRCRLPFYCFSRRY